MYCIQNVPPTRHQPPVMQVQCLVWLSLRYFFEPRGLPWLTACCFIVSSNPQESHLYWVYGALAVYYGMLLFTVYVCGTLWYSTAAPSKGVTWRAPLGREC